MRIHGVLWKKIWDKDPKRAVDLVKEIYSIDLSKLGQNGENLEEVLATEYPRFRSLVRSLEIYQSDES